MYENELTQLAASKVRCLVIGGVAIGLHGYPAATFDLDLWPELSVENLSRMVAVLTRLGYVPRVPVAAEELLDPVKRKQWLDEKNMKFFSFINPQQPRDVVDVMIYHPLDFESCFTRKKTIRIAGREVDIASVGDLLELKKVSFRDKDRHHITVLKRMLEQEHG